MNLLVNKVVKKDFTFKRSRDHYLA